MKTTLMLCWLCGILVLGSAGGGLAVATEPFKEIPPTAKLLNEVRGGGFVLYMRHGKTDSRQPDLSPIDLDDCDTQRPLTDEGRREIVAVGEAVRRAGIPVGRIFASPLCRARESANLAYGSEIQIEPRLMYTAHLTTEQKRPIVAKTRELLSRRVEEPGVNRMLVAHAPNIADLMDYFPETGGTVIVFRPLGDGEFEYVASILPQDWAKLLE